MSDTEDTDDISEINLNNDDAQDHSEDDKENDESEIKITDKVVSAMKKLMTSYNTEATKIVEDSKLKAGELEAGRAKNVLDQLNVMIDLADMAIEDNTSILDEPKKFYQAWNNPNPKDRKLWREVINKEFRDM